MTLTFHPHGTCSRKMTVELADGKVLHLDVQGGCSGNLQGIAKLVEGMEASDVIARLEGIRCGAKATSCPDQLAKALKKELQG